MHATPLFSMLDQHLQPKAAGLLDLGHRFTEFSLDAAPACSFLRAQVFGQLCAGCGGQGELSLLVMAADPEILWRHVQGGLGKIIRCSRGGRLQVQVDCDPCWSFPDTRGWAIYSMAEHLTGPG